MCEVLYRDDGAPFGCVLRPHGGEGTYAYTTTGALGAWASCPTAEAARRAVGPRRVCCGAQARLANPTSCQPWPAPPKADHP